MKILTIWAVCTFCFYVLLAICFGYNPQEWSQECKVWFIGISSFIGVAVGLMAYLDSGEKFVDVDRRRARRGN